MEEKDERGEKERRLEERGDGKRRERWNDCGPDKRQNKMRNLDNPSVHGKPDTS